MSDERVEPRAPGVTPRAKEKKRVVCVDDERHVVEAIALHLHRRYDVTTFTDPREALEALTGPRGPHAIISDHRMPGMTGVEFLSEARRRAPNVARILLTGYSDFNAAISAVNDAGVHRFLMKPCPPDELHRALEASLAAVAEQARADAADLEKLNRLATLGSMAGQIGHEIGNLVAALEGSIEGVRDRMIDPSTAADELGLLEEVRLRLSNHAGHLKHLARPKSVKLEAIDARQLVRRAVELIEATGVVKSARLTLEVGEEPLPLIIDRLAVEGVIINLLKNAGEALHERALSEDPTSPWRAKIAVRVVAAPERAIVTVEDNGPGIPPEALERLFQAFYTTKAEGKGTGLGLTIVKQTIERTGGRIDVASEPGVFTRFTVELPLVP